jgi:phosphoserine phosphatase RsbU/P
MFEHQSPPKGVGRALEQEARFFHVSMELFVIVDLQGEIYRINACVEEKLGYKPEEVVGRSIFEFLLPEDHQRVRAGIEAAANGRKVVDLQCRCVHRDGTLRWLVCSCPPVAPGEDELLVVCHDVTDTRNADERLRQVLDNATAVVYVKNAAGHYLLINRQFEELFKVNRSQVVGKTDFDIFPREIAEVFRTNDLQVLSTGEVLKIEEIAPHDDGPHTYLSVKIPLRNPDSRIYAVAGVSTDITDRIQRMRTDHELQAARRVQEHLYPKSAPELPGFDLSGAVFPASAACGDYFDFIPLSEDTLALVVGDVAGHGLGPALLMVETRAYLRAMLSSGTPPAEALGNLNVLLLDDTPQESFVTLFLAVLDARQRGFFYVGAGHEARLIRASGVTENLESTGLVLGIIPDAPLRRVGPKHLESGDVLLIATDGIVEALSPQKELFGWDRTLNVVRQNQRKPAREIIDALHAAVRQFSSGQRQSDDMTVLIAKAL